MTFRYIINQYIEECIRLYRLSFCRILSSFNPNTQFKTIIFLLTVVFKVWGNRIFIIVI